jgi:hypothetical protein
VDPNRFSVHGFARITDNSPEWYIENGFQYLVFSQGMYGRFYREPERYSKHISLYEQFFDRFALTARFLDGGYEVLIYSVK